MHLHLTISSTGCCILYLHIVGLSKSDSVQGMDYTSIAGPDVRDSQALDGRPRPNAEEEIIGPSNWIFVAIMIVG